MQGWWRFVVCFSAFACSRALAAPLLLTPVQAPGLEDGARIRLDDALRVEVLALGVETVSRSEQARAWAAVPCDGALACSAARARAVDAGSVLVAERLGGAEVVFRVVLHDAVAEVDRARVEVRGAPDRERALLHEAIVRVVAPERYTGHVVVEVEGAEADIIVDGIKAARTPMLVGFAVSPARHEVEAHARGLEPFKRFIDVPFDTIVVIRLAPSQGALVEVAPPPAPAAGARPAGAESQVEPVDPLVSAGVITLVAGGAVLVGGAAFTGIASWQKARWDADQASAEAVAANRVLAPLGLSMLGVGLVAAAVGAGLVVASAMQAPDDGSAAAAQ